MGIQHRDISASNMMYKRINGKVREYLIDFDLASLDGRDSQNLDRTGTMPFMALELLGSVGSGEPLVPHVYAHDGEAVCWVVFWLGVQYENGIRTKYSFQDWEMVDATTCFKNKQYVLEDLQQHPFTEPNKLLQEPIRNLLKKFKIHNMKSEIHNFQKQFGGGELPVPDAGVWIDECDKEIKDPAECISILPSME